MPLEVGRRVKVVQAIDTDIHDVTPFVGRIGILDKIGPDDDAPEYRVRFLSNRGWGSVTEWFFDDELQDAT